MDGDMDEDELEEWKTIFNLFDVDGDQSITGEVTREFIKCRLENFWKKL